MPLACHSSWTMKAISASCVRGSTKYWAMATIVSSPGPGTTPTIASSSW